MTDKSVINLNFRLNTDYVGEEEGQDPVAEWHNKAKAGVWVNASKLFEVSVIQPNTWSKDDGDPHRPEDYIGGAHTYHAFSNTTELETFFRDIEKLGYKIEGEIGKSQIMRAAEAAFKIAEQIRNFGEGRSR